MLLVTETSDRDLIESFVKDPVLWKLMGHTEDISTYVLPSYKRWLSISRKNKPIALMELEAMTAITYVAHIHLTPVYHGTGKSIEVITAVKKYLKKTEIKNILTTVPLCCEHVIKLMAKTGFSTQGIIKDGIIFGGKLQDLLLYQLKV